MKKIGKNLQILSNIKSFINKCNLKWINYPSRKDNWKKFEKNISIIALNVLYIKKWKYIPCLYSKPKLKSCKKSFC